MKELEEIKKELEKEANELKRRTVSRTVTLITSAFGLIAALAWNDAIQSFIKKFFVNSNNALNSKFVYAILVTVLAVIVSLWLDKISWRVKK